ncbi:hypothetical protein ACH40E_38280 [Streptomyces acidicola]|uniref:hypothetical protein n=1 Tax=Streptomyces acidicola TaxID=2596892 RepID=UPI0037882968
MSDPSNQPPADEPNPDPVTPDRLVPYDITLTVPKWWSVYGSAPQTDDGRSPLVPDHPPETSL